MNKRNIFSILLIGLSMCFIFLGFTRGEVQTVFQKAARVCLECIGIG